AATEGTNYRSGSLRHPNAPAARSLVRSPLEPRDPLGHTRSCEWFRRSSTPTPPAQRCARGQDKALWMVSSFLHTLPHRATPTPSPPVRRGEGEMGRGRMPTPVSKTPSLDTCATARKKYND